MHSSLIINTSAWHYQNHFSSVMSLHVLITGINGYISQYLLKFRPQGVSISGTYHSTKLPFEKSLSQIPLDLTKDVCKQLQNIKPDVVIHTAAVSNLAICQNNPDLAHRINSLATKELAHCCAKINARLLYLSTDIVFDGAHAPYAESAEAQPVNIYGKSKYAGELAVKTFEGNTIVRLALVLGEGIAEKKNFVDWLITRIKKNQSIHLFYDEIRTPVCAVDAAKMIWKIVLENITGIVHICSQESVDRYTLGREICKFYNKDFNNFVKVSLKDVALARPKDVSMVNNNRDLVIPAILPQIKRLFLDHE